MTTPQGHLVRRRDAEILRDMGIGDITGESDVWIPPVCGYRFEATSHAYQRTRRNTGRQYASNRVLGE